MVSVLFPSHLCSVSLCPLSLFSVCLWEITNCNRGSVWTSPTLSFFFLHFVWAWNIHRGGGGGGGGGGNESQDLINVLFLWVFAGVFQRCLSFRAFFFCWVWFFSLTHTNTKEGRNLLCFVCVCVCVDVEIWVAIFLPRSILFLVRLLLMVHLVWEERSGKFKVLASGKKPNCCFLTKNSMFEVFLHSRWCW